MRRVALVTALSLVLTLVLAIPSMAATGPRVRVVHASPDAPAVDVWVDGSIAFKNAPFKGITSYATLTAGTHNFQVVPTGATEPVVIDGDYDLQMDRDYTIAAVGLLEDIEPLAIADDNTLPAAGMAHVRFVHLSPNAPEVDVAVSGGPTLFQNVEFKEAKSYVPVAAGTYDLVVRNAGTTVAVLSVPGVTLKERTVYTVWAMGLAPGEPALSAVLSVDAAAAPILLPASGDVGYLLYAGMGLASLGLAAVGLGLKRRTRD